MSDEIAEITARLQTLYYHLFTLGLGVPMLRPQCNYLRRLLLIGAKLTLDDKPRLAPIRSRPWKGGSGSLRTLVAHDWLTALLTFG